MCLAIWVSSCSESTEDLPYYSTYDFTPDWNVPDHKIASFEFESHRNQKINNQTFEGKVYVANFFFTTCPSICPMLTSNLTAVQETYREDPNVGIISHTVTPWIDSIPKLQAYAESQGIDDPNWHLVTGERAKLYTLARSSYFADMQDGIPKDVGEFLHSENLVLIDANGYIRGVYNGTLKVEVKQLIDDINTLRSQFPT